MRIAQHTIWIPRSPETVFDFFVDCTQAHRWRQYVRTMVPLDQRPLQAGSRLRVVMDINGGAFEFEMQVLVCDRPSLWRHRTDEADFNGYIEYKFEPENSGTRVTLSIEAKPVGLYGWLALPLFKLRREPPYLEQLPQLKRAIEAAG